VSTPRAPPSAAPLLAPLARPAPPRSNPRLYALALRSLWTALTRCPLPPLDPLSGPLLPVSARLPIKKFLRKNVVLDEIEAKTDTISQDIKDWLYGLETKVGGAALPPPHP
jgi:hypothetical protein